MEHRQALNSAEKLIEWLRPACERIEIAGSVRRGKADCGDIELVVIPKAGAPRPEFGRKNVFPRFLEQVLDNMENQRGLIEMVKGGEKYKQFWLLEGRVHLIKVDLFIVTPPAQWGVIDMIRTGPDTFSRWMVTQKSKGGALPDDHFVKDGCMWVHGDGKTWPPSTVVNIPEEADYFTLCGMEWIPPEKRAESPHA